MPAIPDRWWEDAFFGLHYDLHANANDTELGAELTHEHLREMLARVKPDFVQCDCKGHPGYASYPTKVGSPSPGIVKDALRIHRDVTAEMGIPLSVHYSGVWDDRAVELHPEWARVDAEGLSGGGHGERRAGYTCLLSPYVDELMIPQLLELIDLYDVDGFWVDGENWAVRDCYCDRCRAEFTRRTGIADPPTSRDHTDWTMWRAFIRDIFVEHVARYADAVHARKPNCAVCSNWMYSLRQPGPVAAPVDYISGDFSPSFGCERAQAEGHYMSGHNMPWNLMAWTFTWTFPGHSDHRRAVWQAKTAVGLCQEVAEVMSCGGAVFLYDVPQRTGWLTGWHQDIFAQVADFCRDRQPFSQHTVSVPDAAVLVSDTHMYRHNAEPFCIGESTHAIEGALHLLMENQYDVDLLDETRLIERMAQYALVAVAEQNPIPDEMSAALEAYAQRGGTVLITGAHLADVHPQLTGVEAAGEPNEKPWHVAVAGEAATISGPWRPVRVVNADAHTPLMDQQEPGKDDTAYPAVTIRKAGSGQVVAIHGAFMRTYYLSHHPRQRAFTAALLNSLDLDRNLNVVAPPTIEVAVRAGADMLAVHLVNRACDPPTTPRAHIVERVPPVGPVEVSLRLQQAPQRVRLQPGDREPDHTYSDGWLDVTIPQVHIHDIIVVE